MAQASRFWQFSLSIYRMEGVPPSCIALQDGHGLDVNLMLFALWLASEGRAVSAQDIRAADDAVAEWRAQAVVSLRGVRRYLRNPPPTFDSSDVSALRDRIKSVELESERLQQEALFALRPSNLWGRPEDSRSAGAINMDACAESIGCAFEQAPRDAILGAYAALIARAAS